MGDTNQILCAYMTRERTDGVIQMLVSALTSDVAKQHFGGSLGIYPSVGKEFFTLR